MNKITNCHDCNAKPGHIHESGCDVEICSVCGNQWIDCGHEEHEQEFARWTGIWPGLAESEYLGIDLTEFISSNIYRSFFIKPE